MLLHLVEFYMRRTRTPPSRFGRDAVGDPKFVFNLREGREPRRRTRQRVIAFMTARDEDNLTGFDL